MRFFIRRLGGSPSRCFNLYNRIIRAGNPDGAIVAFQAAIVADFQSKRTVSGGWKAGEHTLSTTVASLFVHFIFVVIIHGIVRIHIPHYPPLQSILRADLSCGDPSFVRHAAYIHVSRAKHSITALIVVVDRLYGGMA